MFDFERLREQLDRRDVLLIWKKGVFYRVGKINHVEFAASIAIRSKQHARPAGVDFCDADIELDLQFQDECELQNITSCDAQVSIEGVDKNNTKCNFALHFDMHDVSQKTNDLHALYHWQFGGKKLANANFGSLVFFEGPRFPYHPLDPVLLVDFVLGHFHGSERDVLLTIETSGRAYADMLKSSQDKLVKPFFCQIYDALQSGKLTHTVHLWPSLCGEP